MKYLLLLIPLVALVCDYKKSFGQTSYMDSVIYSKNLHIRKNTVPMYYAKECEERGMQSQLLLKKLIENYSSSDNTAFNLKLAVVDSSQWSFYYPYGFFFVSQGWIVIPGDLDFHKFSRLWGFSNFSGTVKNELTKISNNTEELLTDALYSFGVCHELGHYYIKNVLNALTPDRWTSEITASYLATEFLYNYNENNIEAYNIFTSTFATEYEPKFNTLTNFNQKYTQVGLKNYIWYHCMFQSLITDVHSKYKNEFLELYARTFPKTIGKEEYTQEEIIKKMDSITDGKAIEWIKFIEEH